jgi:hypothetical protein
MLRRSHVPKLVTGLALAAFLVVPLSATAGGKPNPGKGQPKVTICHKGKVTIRVGLPALKAHLKHGDKVGRCGTHPAPGTARLTVIKQVVNDNGGTRHAGDFTIAINGVNASGGNSFAGSATGVTKTITTFGAYSVTESTVPGYELKNASTGCSGTIAAGDMKVCLLTNDDKAAKLTVVKSVINDHGGTKTAADFTITINGVTAVGGNTFAGSGAGVTKTLMSVGAYSVTEGVVAGYVLQSSSAGCSGTIALGESRTCVLTNNDV